MADFPSANQVLFDQALRRQVLLRRYTAGEVKRAAQLLGDSEKALVALLFAKLDRLAGRGIPAAGSATAKRLEALIKEVVSLRADAWAAVRGDVTEALKELARAEGLNEFSTLDDAVPIKLDLVAPPVGKVVQAAVARPLQGQLLSEWYKKLEQADRRALTEAVRLGVIQGEKVDEIVRRVRGTKAGDPGAFGAARRNLEAMVSTAVSHVANAAREEVWMANADIIEGLRWTSTLDGRTSAVCRARDGKIYAVGEGPRPPAHVRCRSVMVPILSGVGVVGSRPTVTDTRGRREREVDFRRQAKESGVSVQAARAAWAKANVGSTPGETTYNDFLKRQSAAFQDEVLGVAKGRLFRQGGLSLDAFVDRAGNELTLEQLRKARPDAWNKAFGD